MDRNRSARQVALAGEVTIFTAEEIRRQLLAAIDGEDDVDVDLSQVTEIDTAGVQLIVAALREAAQRGRELSFTAGSAPVVEVMGLLGLSSCMAGAAAPDA